MQLLQAKHQLPNQLSRAMEAPAVARAWHPASFASVASTAKWTAKKMMRMSWDDRNRLFERFETNKPQLFLLLLRGQFCSDELLAGTSTGMPPPAVVVLPNKRKRQTAIEDYFTKQAAM
jgi:hypothetical protein